MPAHRTARRNPAVLPSLAAAQALCDDGKFKSLNEILERTVPFMRGAVQAYDGSEEAAATVVKAGVLACVAGDGCVRSWPTFCCAVAAAVQASL